MKGKGRRQEQTSKQVNTAGKLTNERKRTETGAKAHDKTKTEQKLALDITLPTHHMGRASTLMQC